MKILLALSESGQERLDRLIAEIAELEAAWRTPMDNESEKLERVRALQAAVDETSQFSREDLAPLLRSSLILQDSENVRLTPTEGSLRMQGPGGLDARLSEDEGQLVLEGRRRPAFHLYEYLTCRLGPGLEEESRIESAEGLQIRRRDRAGQLLY